MGYQNQILMESINSTTASIGPYSENQFCTRISSTLAWWEEGLLYELLDDGP